jgi:replicative DNA helicase
MQNDSDITGVATGFTDIDKMTSGLQQGDLIIIAGRPSMGKTSLALNMAENVAIDSKLPVAVFSMEMASLQLATRLIGSVGRVDQHKMRTGQLDDNDWEKLTDSLGQLNEAPIHIDEGSGLNTYEVRARARRLQRQVGQLGLIIIDYIQLMSAPMGKQAENRATEISEISRSLKSLAKELKVPIVALSQLNRSVEQRVDKRPVMSDLRESGAIEQDADVIMFIYRDEVYNPETADKGLAEILLAKQRNGPTGMVKLTFMGQFTRFENYANPGYDLGY